MDKVEHYEYIVVGGGITGAGVFRDLVLHDKKTLLIDKKEFMTQTSSQSSKMLHGGIRYLEHLEFSLVKEALNEKNTWKDLAPDFTKELEFIIPVYKDSPHTFWKLYAGVKLYDTLSMFRNKPSGKLSKKDLIKRLPHLNSKSLIGAITYHDVIIDDKDFGKSIIESVNSNKNAITLENTEILKISEKSPFTITLKNHKEFTIRADEIIFCTGPFTDQIMKKLDFNWKPKILPSKGSHLILDKNKIDCPHPIVIQEQNRIIFLIPHDEFVLLGTTELKLTKGDDFFDLDISEQEKKYLIRNFKHYFPRLEIENAIIGQTAGVRPLVIKNGINESQAPGAASRQHLIFQPKNNCSILIGGKYTTFRKMAADVVSKIFARKQLTYYPNLSLKPIHKTKS